MKIFKWCVSVVSLSILAMVILCFLLKDFYHINKPLTVALNANVMVISNANEGTAYGSGVVFLNKGHVFVWTCHHVVSELVTMDLKFDVNTQKYITSRDIGQPILASKIFNDDHEVIGEARFPARIIRFSAADDLALLEIAPNSCFKTSASFPLRTSVLLPGIRLLHVGNFGGPSGMFSVSEGIMGIAGLDLDNDGKVYDRVSMAFQPGSSGGGIYDTKTGNCVGIVARTINRIAYNQGLMVPHRRMVEFAERLECMWALNHAEDVPWDYQRVLTDDAYVVPEPIRRLLDKAH